MRNSASRPVPPTLVDANRLWVDSRVRALVQRRVEAPVLLRLGGPVSGGRVLELGYHVLHHADTWRDVVREAARVLRPGGRLYSCEMTALFVDSRPLRAVSRHPADGDRPTPDGLAACRAAALTVTAQDTRLAGCWTALVATRA
jgi:SAM-dependent methyltransferase